MTCRAWRRVNEEVGSSVARSLLAAGDAAIVPCQREESKAGA